MSDLCIKAETLTKRFGPLLAVDNVSLEIPRAKIFGFLGPNGSGKSTILRMLTGLLKPSEGQIEVLGYRLPRQAEKIRGKIGYMTQSFSLYRDLSVAENLNFVAKIYNFDKHRARKRVSELLALYQLEQHASQIVGKLSGGEQQRLSLAAAILHEPELLFLDEPTAAVDPQSRRDFWENLFELSERGTTILVSTHYMDEAERCHSLGILTLGRLVALGTPLALMQALDARVVELEGETLRDIKHRLLIFPEIVSIAQQGMRLRVLVDETVGSPEKWIKAQLKLEDDALDISNVRPNLEDVFVKITQRSKNAC